MEHVYYCARHYGILRAKSDKILACKCQGRETIHKS